MSERNPDVSILFFAEGNRSRDGSYRAFKMGAFATALDFKLPILPIAVAGTFDIWRPGSLLVHAARSCSRSAHRSRSTACRATTAPGCATRPMRPSPSCARARVPACARAAWNPAASTEVDSRDGTPLDPPARDARTRPARARVEPGRDPAAVPARLRERRARLGLGRAGLAPHYRVVALDQRGHGDSGRDPDGRYDHETMARDATRRSSRSARRARCWSDTRSAGASPCASRGPFRRSSRDS